MSNFPNASPRVEARGTEDKSIGVPAVEREQIPTHCPKFMFFARTGPLTDQLVSGAGAVSMYGQDTWDLLKKYATHTTAAVKVAFEAGQSAIMAKRIVPADAGPKANACLWLDVVEDNIPLYVRDDEGMISRDRFGDPVTTGQTIRGYRLQWSVTRITKETNVDLIGFPNARTSDSDLFGKQVRSISPLTSSLSGVSGWRYPVFEFWDNFPGEGGNDAGLSIYAPTTKFSDPINTNVLRALKAFPYRMEFRRRANASSTARSVNMLDGAQALEFVLPKKMINPDTESPISIDRVFPEAWQKPVNPGFVPVFAEVGSFYVYENNIDEILDNLYAAERAYVVASAVGDLARGTDLSPTATDQKNMMNFVSATSSNGAPYYTVHMEAPSAQNVQLIQSNTIFQGGGDDGTMNARTLGEAVRAEMARYLDPNDDVQNDAVAVESWMWDTGFDLETKKTLGNFIALRKDTFVVSSTHQHRAIVGGGPEYPVQEQELLLSSADESALAASIRTSLTMFTESAYYGTPTMRALVMGRHGRLVGFPWYDRVPLTFDLLEKVCKMMGAANGRWKTEFLFDHANRNRRNIVTRVNDLNDSWTPPAVRNKDWDNGLNYAMDFSRSETYYPALKTVYGEDTSVLTSMFTAAACAVLQRIGNKAHREFSGAIGLSGDQLVERVNAFVYKEIDGVFGNMFTIVPKCTITGGDKKTGYRWTLPILIGADNMKTVQTLSVHAFRRDEMPA